MRCALLYDSSMETKRKTREPARQLPVRESVYQRVLQYIDDQPVRPLLTDVVSAAVERYLDEQEQHEDWKHSENVHDL